MSVSKSETNIPKIRKPFSAELIPRVPYIAQDDVGVNDTTNKLVTPVIVKNRQIVEAQQVTTKEYVDANLITGEYYQKFTVNPYNFDSEEAIAAGFSVGNATKVAFRDYKGDSISGTSGSNYNIRPLEYTVKHNSLVNIEFAEYCRTGGGDVVVAYLLSKDKSGNKVWVPIQRFAEKFGNLDEIHSAQFPCRIGTKFRFVLFSGTISHKSSGNTLGQYWYQPISFEKVSTNTKGKIHITTVDGVKTWNIPYYIANDASVKYKVGDSGGITITEYVLSGTEVGGDGSIEPEDQGGDSGSGDDPSGGDGSDPVIIETSNIGHDNANDVMLVYVKDGKIIAPVNNSGADNKPVCVKNGAIVPCSLPVSAPFLGTNANGELVVRDTPEKFVVAFRNADYTLLGICSVKPGNAAIAPSNPTAPTGYEFAGWDKAYNNITSDLLVTATYRIKQYTVTFVDWNGTTLKTQTVNHGGNATPPSNPTRTGYNFTGWSGEYTNVTSNRTITAQYTIKQFTVTFNYYNGTTAKTSNQTVNYGGNATAPTDTTRTGHTFNGWDRGYTNVTTNITVNAVYTAITFTVNFWANSSKQNLIKTQQVTYGDTVTCDSPSISRLTFERWNRIGGSSDYGSPITDNTDYAASYIFSTTGELEVPGGSDGKDYAWYVYFTKPDSGLVTQHMDLVYNGFGIEVVAFTGTLQHTASPNHQFQGSLYIYSGSGMAGHGETLIYEQIKAINSTTMSFSYSAPSTRSVQWNNYDDSYTPAAGNHYMTLSLPSGSISTNDIQIHFGGVKTDTCSVKWLFSFTDVRFRFY